MRGVCSGCDFDGRAGRIYEILMSKRSHFQRSPRSGTFADSGASRVRREPSGLGMSDNATMAEQDFACAACQDTEEGALCYLVCGHHFHDMCLTRLMHAQHYAELINVPCPTCRKTGSELTVLSQRMTTSGGAQPATEVSSAAPAARSFPRPLRRGHFVMPTSQGGVQTLRAPQRRQSHNRSRSRSQGSPAAVRAPPSSPPPSQPSQSQSMSPTQSITTSQGGRPVPISSSDTFGFSFADSSRSSGSAAPISDPLTAELEAFARSSAPDHVRRLLHPRELFDGLENEAATRATAKRWLDEIMEDPRTHLEVGYDPTFSIRLLVPTLFHTSIVTVAAQEGWQPEPLMQGIQSNTGWMEHHETVCKEFAEEHHARQTTIPLFGAGAPSTRKTSLERFISQELIPIDWLRACVCSDATLKGFLNCIANENRSGVVNSEATTAYETKQSENAKGTHWMGKPKMLVFVNGERSVTMTGHGAVSLDVYGFLHQVWGQTAVLEEILARDGIGFRKRFNTVWFCRTNGIRNQLSFVSRAFLKEYFEWLGQYALPHPQEHFYDAFARSMYQGFMGGVEDFLEGHPGIDQVIKEKLEFADTDIQRLTNAEMRMCQFAQTKNAQTQNQGERKQWDVYDLAHALHAWRRQISLYVAHTKWDAVHGPRPVKDIKRPASSAATPAQLDLNLYTRELIFGDRRCKGRVDSKTVRVWVRSRLSAQGEPDVCGKIHKQISAAAEVGVVTLIEAPPATEDEVARKKKGRPVLTFEKREWSQMDQRARDFVAAAGLNADHFSSPTEQEF